ncbi:MAG: Mrp/NBP35 family ATP-binding protein [Verrucomicrobiae bacterium]|nr:Mrp/NBP35 family ATP-binding protein [Verrucomicrobiae bacterium]
MPITEQQVRNILRQVRYPGYTRDIVSFGFVKDIQISDHDLLVHLEVPSTNPNAVAQIKADVETALKTLPGLRRLTVQASSPATAAAAGLPSQKPLEGVRHTVAIGSGKGGVGKTTVAVNLACALQELGLRVGLLDADIYGPSVPKMVGTLEPPTISGNWILPVERHGLKLMSMALLIEPHQAVIWRGPMIMKAMQQFLHEVRWAPLDILLVDLPPGTGDAQISLAQLARLDGAVVVSTPQEVATEVVRRGLTMFDKVNIRILGVIENMSYYICPHCGQRDELFGHNGTEHLGIPVLFRLPLSTEIRTCADQGTPLVRARPDSAVARAFREGAGRLWELLQ